MHTLLKCCYVQQDPQYQQKEKGSLEIKLIIYKINICIPMTVVIQITIYIIIIYTNKSLSKQVFKQTHKVKFHIHVYTNVF